MCSEFVTQQKNVLLTTQPNLNDKKTRQVTKISYQNLWKISRTLCQSLFKTSPVTRRPSLKGLSGIQEQLLRLCMGKHQILQNCSLSLRLNFIFEITNEIRQQLCHKCCFFCSNSVIKSLFLRLDQPVRMRSVTVSIATGTSNGSCSDALTLPISSFIQKVGLPAIERPY